MKAKAIIGEAGPELLPTSRGARVEPVHINHVLYIDGREVGEQVRKLTSGEVNRRGLRVAVARALRRLASRLDH